jgi:hypothetical protein
MIGAAYYRELYLRKKQGEKINLCSNTYRDRICGDILNPVSFTIATSDVFIRFQKFSDGPYTYTKDRGYMFEKYMDKNLGNVFDSKRLYEYRIPEERAIIPMMVFSPVIINHGRKLIISSQPVSFFTHMKPGGNVKNQPCFGNIEFSKFFHKQNAQNIRFTSVLRMNSTFPYVMPMVTLPSEPLTECMDAGLRDNYGSHLAVHFIFEFSKWIEHNTSGVIILNIRDRQKIVDTPRNNSSLYKRMIKPASNVVDNIFFSQDFDDDYLMYFMQSMTLSKIETIDLCLRHDEKHKVSLSWHLTQVEKQQVLSSISFPENKEALQRLKQLLSE